MLEEARFSYDPGSCRLTYLAGLRAGSLLPAETATELGRIARAETWKGQPVKSVTVRFGDDATARANADAMSFARILSEGPGGLATSDARFPAREDFGIAEE